MIATTTNGVLVAGRSRIVTREELGAIPAPLSLGSRHAPVRFADLVGTLDGVLRDAGLAIRDEKFAVCKADSRLFGVLQVEPTRADHPLTPAVREGQGFAIGLRSSVDCRLSLRLNASARIFVCSNLCMSGTSILVRKNTTGLDLPRALAAGVERYVGAQLQLTADIDRAREAMVTDEQAKVILHEVFARRVLPARLFAEVAGNYFAPVPTEDCAPRSVWGVHNSLTRAMRAMPPAPRFRATIALASLLRPGVN